MCPLYVLRRVAAERRYPMPRPLALLDAFLITRLPHPCSSSLLVHQLTHTFSKSCPLQVAKPLKAMVGVDYAVDLCAAGFSAIALLQVNFPHLLRLLNS